VLQLLQLPAVQVHVVPPLGKLPTVHDAPELEPELEPLADPELDPELEPDDPELPELPEELVLPEEDEPDPEENVASGGWAPELDAPPPDPLEEAPEAAPDSAGLAPPASSPLPKEPPPDEEPQAAARARANGTTARVVLMGSSLLIRNTAASRSVATGLAHGSLAALGRRGSRPDTRARHYSKTSRTSHQQPNGAERRG
jgi:hypothetical protein